MSITSQVIARRDSVPGMTAVGDRAPLGALLRDWRQRRRMSQLDLALEAGVSARHLSFLETGRSKPSREMVLHLAEELDVPLRERNRLLLAAGFAPAFDERPLEAPELEPVRRADTPASRARSSWLMRRRRRQSRSSSPSGAARSAVAVIDMTILTSALTF